MFDILKILLYVAAHPASGLADENRFARAGQKRRKNEKDLAKHSSIDWSVEL
jgi:hypothetical protein